MKKEWVTFENKNQYYGEWDISSNKPHGRGFLIGGSDSIVWKYVGYFKNGKQEGKGKLTFVSGNVYEGDFKDGLKHGKGVFIGKGKKYEGEYVEGKKHGYGEYTDTDGSIYKGNYSKNNKSGKGMLYDPKTKTWKECIDGKVVDKKNP